MPPQAFGIEVIAIVIAITAVPKKILDMITLPFNGKGLQ